MSQNFSLNFSESNYRCLLIKKRDSEGKVLEMELGIHKFFSTDIFSPLKTIEIVIEFVRYLQRYVNSP